MGQKKSEIDDIKAKAADLVLAIEKIQCEKVSEAGRYKYQAIAQVQQAVILASRAISANESQRQTAT
jgi:hypothetical protein